MPIWGGVLQAYELNTPPIAFPRHPLHSDPAQKTLGCISRVDQIISWDFEARPEQCMGVWANHRVEEPEAHPKKEKSQWNGLQDV